MAAPTIAVNRLDPPTVNPGGHTTWTTVATDADATTHTVRRTVADAAGGTVVFQAQLTVGDPLTYSPPTCDDPRVSFEVDPDDPTVVTVNVAS